MEQPSTLTVALTLLITTAMFASFIQWAQYLWRFRSDLGSLPEYLVPYQRREQPFWNPGAAMLMFGAMQVIAGLSVAGLLSGGWVTRGDGAKSASGAMILITVNTAVGVVASLITMAWLRSRDKEFIDKLSLRLNDSDGLLGLKAAVMILPPVLLVNLVASQLMTYEHPVLDSMVGLQDPLKFAMIFIGTAIVAPFVEEFLFRVLLQGGLERVADPIVAPEESTEAAVQSLAWRPRSHWPIFVSSLIFALMHLGQGAAPIPLFFLAIGLGYLYRQTGNITAPMIVHMVLNGTTVVAEAIRQMG